MSAIHANVHTVEHVAPRDNRKVEVRDQRTAKPQPIVRDHDDSRRVELRPDRDRDRDRDRERPVIVQSAPVVVTTPAYETSWTPAPSYTYQPQAISLLGATSLASDQLSIDTTGQLVGATSLQLESTGSGATYVNQVVVYDASGDYQVMNVNAMLSPSNPTVRLALENGASIVKISLTGHSDWGGSIALNAV